MKKIILTILIIFFAIPSVALASWWNPFSWFNFFQRTETYQNETFVVATSSDENLDKEIVIEEEVPVNNASQVTPVYVQDIVVDTPMPSPVVLSENEEKEESKLQEELRQLEAEQALIQQSLDNQRAEATPIDIYAKYRDPKTGEILSPEEFGKRARAYCSNKNKVVDNTNIANDDGTINCITYNQSCQNTFGTSFVYSGEKDNDGQIYCMCKSGYTISSDGKSCQRQQQGDGDYDPYNVLSGSGNAYSPEQLNSIDCAYYGRNCSAPAPVQMNNYYQYTPPTTQTQTVNCDNYQIEKNNLDELHAQSGTLFSGARINAENALKARYAGCY